MNKKVLLIEPNYSNKFPPVGLMKIAAYYKNLGNWEVTFFKGDLKHFVIERIADKCIKEFCFIDDTIEWYLKRDEFVEYIKTKKKTILDLLEIDKSDMAIILYSKIEYYKNYYWKGEWKEHPEWDRVGITTLFTFYWDITVETINFAKFLVKDLKDIMVGGVLASIQPKELKEATGIKPYVGILGPGSLDEGDTQYIDNLPLDYSILDEIDYKYPMSNAYYGYTTRGCIRKCPFCAVPTLEPIYNSYIPLKERIDLVRKTYGEQKDLLLMDNNVLASKNLDSIIQDIVDSGFGRGAKYVQPNLLEIAVRNLKNGINDRAYIRKCYELISEFYEKLHGEESFNVYKVIQKYKIYKLSICKKDNLIMAYEEIKELYKKHFHPAPRLRYVDFNQGVDARLFNERNVALLARIAIRPLRIAFDDIKTRPAYEKAIRMSAAAGIKEFSNYLLYNFQDNPVDLYTRLRINVDFCDELKVNIYSFPMKYHPIRKGEQDEEDLSHTRDYVGKNWNIKYVRGVQVILNSTKGMVGKGKSFFLEAFGNNEEEYIELLEMPEVFILYRFFFKWLDEQGLKGSEHWRRTWLKCKKELPTEEWNEVESIIHNNDFKSLNIENLHNPLSQELLSFYTISRKDISDETGRLYSLKKEYDQTLNKELKIKKSI